MSPLLFDAIVFDLDGVITKTAQVHNAAWTETFNDFLKAYSEKHGQEYKAFTYENDYLPYVDGKPRYKGVASFLASRGIELPYGDPSDPPSQDSICGLGNLKNDRFNNLIKQGMVEVFPSTVELIKDLKSSGVHIGVASSSKNCQTILQAADIEDLFDTRVDGIVSAELGLEGKPAPDIFTFAAENLGASFHRTIIVEDAVSGVKAGQIGNFGLVIGVARANNEAALLANGADIVLSDLSEITLEDLNKWFTEGLEQDCWSISYHDYLPESERVRESLLAIGNGYFGTRGALEEQSANQINYPGTYLAGLYNRLETQIAGRRIINEDFPNCPNWLTLTFRIGNGSWMDLNQVEILKIHRRLDFRTGTLTKKITIQDDEGQITSIISKRIASMANPHLGVIRYEITPLNYSGMMTIKSSIDGDIINAGVDRYRDLNSKHLEPVSSGGEGNLSFLEMVTNQSGVRIATAAKIQVYLNGRPISPPIAHSGMTGVTSAQISVDGIQNTPIGIDKIMSMYTSRDWDSDHPLESAKSLLSADHDFEEIYQESINAWKEIWEKGDIIVKGDRRTQKLLRLSLYHLFITASPHNDQIDAGIPARGLHGEAYRGHIFWDELFILPFINLHFPEITRSALMYRFRRIDRARDYAREFGYQGAMYPWQSGSTGWEETPTIHLNPISKEWGPDNSSLQRHISLAIAYNIWSYYCLTQDMDFLEDYGAEIFFEICRFWASAVSLNEGSSRYEIHRVMGPDEFHEKYPNAEEGGLSNNAYTNIMVLWALSTAREIVDIMEEDKRKEVFNKIHLTEEEWDHWKDIQHKILIPISDLGLLEQFQGFFSLEELNWNQYQKKYSDISRMDRILKNEGKSPDDYQVLKQADVLMSFYLLDEFEVKELLNTAGYSWENRYLEENIHYYLRRTSHGSTLSYLVHAYLCSLIDEDQSAWEFYQQALQSDYIDIQGGTTGEGIHTGVMAGSVYNTLRIYGGLSFKGNQLHLWPNLPDQWQELAFNINFRDQNYAIRITSEDIWIKISGQEPGLTEMKFHGESTYIQNDMWTALPARKEQ